MATSASKGGATVSKSGSGYSYSYGGKTGYSNTASGAAKGLSGLMSSSSSSSSSGGSKSSSSGGSSYSGGSSSSGSSSSGTTKTATYGGVNVGINSNGTYTVGGKTYSNATDAANAIKSNASYQGLGSNSNTSFTTANGNSYSSKTGWAAPVLQATGVQGAQFGEGVKQYGADANNYMEDRNTYLAGNLAGKGFNSVTDLHNYLAMNNKGFASASASDQAKTADAIWRKMNNMGNVQKQDLTEDQAIFDLFGNQDKNEEVEEYTPLDYEPEYEEPQYEEPRQEPKNTDNIQDEEWSTKFDELLGNTKSDVVEADKLATDTTPQINIVNTAAARDAFDNGNDRVYMQAVESEQAPQEEVKDTAVDVQPQQDIETTPGTVESEQQVTNEDSNQSIEEADIPEATVEDANNAFDALIGGNNNEEMVATEDGSVEQEIPITEDAIEDLNAMDEAGDYSDLEGKYRSIINDLKNYALKTGKGRDWILGELEKVKQHPIWKKHQR